MQLDFRNHMENVQVEQVGSRLEISIDTDQRLGLSRSGKSSIIATSHGSQLLSAGIRLTITLSEDLPGENIHKLPYYLRS